MNSTVLMLVCLMVFVPATTNAFYLFFPQANDRIMALEVADQAAARYPSIDPEEILAEAAKRDASTSLRRRSADSYHCPCLHKVCTYHCMTK